MHLLLTQKLSKQFGVAGAVQLQPVGGGSINETYQVRFGKHQFFLKHNSATKFPHLFTREKYGLDFLAKQHCIKTPTVIDCFEDNGSQFLLLEWINEGERNAAFWKRFGEALAALHRVQSNAYGFTEDNYMGSVPQSNDRQTSWCSFLSEQRLRPLIGRCYEKNLLGRNHLLQFETLERKLSTIFEEEPPSLLHGDLWSGNFLCNHSCEPVLIDPAVYFGHRSMDLGMTTLFGGFHPQFYEAYNHYYPFPANYKEQWQVCNLYPLLIHLFLFGSSYKSRIESILRNFC